MRQLAERDHGHEDEADDEHHEHRLPAFLGGGLHGEQMEHGGNLVHAAGGVPGVRGRVCYRTAFSAWCAASARSTASSPAAARAAASSGSNSPRRRNAARASSSRPPAPSNAALAAHRAPSPSACSARSWLQSEISSDRSATASVSPKEAIRTRPWAYR